MPSGTVPPADVEAALSRILDSATFRGADRSRRLLQFIVRMTLDGRADRLKDYTLGAEALGRGDDFDPRTDPTARAEASRLRSRLDLYYASEGAADDVRILVPKGGYVPLFERRAPPESPPRPGPLEPDHSVAPPERSSGTRRWSSAWLALPAGALAALATWLLASSPLPTAPYETRVELTTPPTPDPASLAISPDGRLLAFVASEGGVQRIWTRNLGTGQTTALAGTEYGSLPFWSPDGNALGFFVEGQVKTLDLRSHVIRTVSTAPVPAGATWNSDGVILHPLVPDSPLYRTDETQGGLTPASELTEGQTGHRGPAFLPDGRRFLYYAAGSTAARGIYIGELGSLRARRLLDADTPAVFVPPRHLLYVQHGSLLACAFDPASATITGKPGVIADHVEGESVLGLAALSASRSGTVVYRTGPVGTRRQFIWVDRHGSKLAAVGSDEERGPSYASISPDGRRLAVQRSMDGNTDIWLVDLERGTPVRFTSDPEPDIAPAWSPHGDRIGYASLVNGVFQLFERPLNGGERRPLVQTANAKQMTDWSRDGSYVLYRSVALRPALDTDIWAIRVDDANGTPLPVIRTPFEERDAQFSPDGKWIAYQSKESGRFEVYVQPFGREGERLRVSTEGGVQARWRSDGRELFYLAPDGQLIAVPLSPGELGRSLRAASATPLFRTSVGAPQGVSLHSYLVAPDGQRFLIDSIVEQRAAPVAIILNWNQLRE